MNNTGWVTQPVPQASLREAGRLERFDFGHPWVSWLLTCAILVALGLMLGLAFGAPVGDRWSSLVLISSAMIGTRIGAYARR